MSIEREAVVRLYVVERRSTCEIARMFGCTKATVRRTLVRYGIPRRGLREAFAVSKTHNGNNPVRGAAHPSWKGGFRIKCGYRMVQRPSHPDADACGYVMEHRLVAAAVLGRPLADDEEVHHINEDRLDNRPANLDVMTKAAHMAMHMRARHKAGKIPYYTRRAS